LEPEIRTKQDRFLSKVSYVLEDCDYLSFGDIKYPVIGHLTKLRKRFSDYFPDLDSYTVSWVVNPFNCEIADVPEEPEGLAEALLQHRSNNEARIEFQNKAHLSFFGGGDVMSCENFQNCT
jgi:hypothetical protein